MDIPSEQIRNLGDAAALAVLELILRKAGLEPHPFAKDHPDDQLREALGQPDLPPIGPPPAKPPTDGEICRATLLYLAERDEAFRESIRHVVSRSPEQSVAAMRDPGTFALGALVVLAFHTDLELRKQPDKGWYFHFKIKPLPDSTIGKVLTMLYAKFLEEGGKAGEGS